MSPLLSFIVPVYCEGLLLTQTLHQLQNLRSRCAEIIVVDGAGCDALNAEVIALSDQVLSSAPGRARQMNIGAQAATGQFLVFLHADTEISESLFKPLMVQAPPARRWGFFRVRIQPSVGFLPLVAFFMNLRSHLTGIGTGDQTLWVDRLWFAEMGGYADQYLMEDIELCARLRKVVAPLLLPGFVHTSARRWQQNGQLRTILGMWWLRLQYWLGVDANVLARKYYATHDFEKLS